ncbi:MAG: hypothetical protein ONB48_04440 [candidate division KSB1 bacterium]|nr:hypothetical protein [candidate division KSB1 bacterium]MDZ7274441.1 hypothetical protein [candidate division KSB1 bacterium]MDZ7284897.1 hypothetical protein [candidate division KSB1 bacterium]MDZ7297682.1 hypothetical protein [candidate division KSB1 bacterium]MDZ7305894.1 hypothetical protein [candidate division KSB1 bacterium]
MARLITAALSLLTTAWAASQNERSLAEVLAKATQLRQEGSPRAAIRTCFQKHAEGQLFERASLALQERFLFEYIDACMHAADRLPLREARIYLEEAITVARRYLKWCRGPGAGLVNQWRQEGSDRERIPAVTFALGIAHKRLAAQQSAQRRALLEAYEEIAALSAHFFSPRSLELWEETLRMYPAFVRVETNDRRIRERIKNDLEYRERWQAYQKFLEAFESVPRMRTLARNKRKMVFTLLRES